MLNLICMQKSVSYVHDSQIKFMILFRVQPCMCNHKPKHNGRLSGGYFLTACQNLFSNTPHCALGVRSGLLTKNVRSLACHLVNMSTKLA